MKLKEILALIKDGLKKEPEYELSYQHGIKLDSFSHIKNANIKYTGFFFNILKFFYKLIINIRFSRRALLPGNQVLIYAGTSNQLISLEPTIRALEENKVGFTLLAPSKLINTGVNCKLTLKEAFIALYLFIKYAPKLYLFLKKNNKSLELKKFFYHYCFSYLNLTYFASVLLQLININSVSLVVMSNDHNQENRCLRLLSEILGVKTLYMQHASVSDLFPPLEYDYALLDGEISYETYKCCRNHLPNINKYPVNVFFSGQKKQIKVNHKIKKAYNIGLAVNVLDDIEKVKELISDFPELKFFIRTHPAQTKLFIKEVLNLTRNNNIDWCDPKKTSLSDFFSSIYCLIAANSSIHLEAALAKVNTFYYEFSTDVDIADYYGYVKNGVAKDLKKEISPEFIKDFFETNCHYIPSNAVQKYSATYNTKWEHNEGILAAKLIQLIIDNKSVEHIFYPPVKEENFNVFKLKS